jgi:hypothetical protein
MLKGLVRQLLPSEFEQYSIEIYGFPSLETFASKMFTMFGCPASLAKLFASEMKLIAEGELLSNFFTKTFTATSRLGTD